MEDPEIEVTATEIAETRDYKGRSKAKERDTEKTLERATHTHTHTSTSFHLAVHVQQYQMQQGEKAFGGDEEDVNFISGIGFQNQRSGNQSGNINFHSNGQRGNYNQSSQYQKSYCNNYNNNNTTFGSSSYQNPPLETQESKIEGA
ncbi:hypothetical protein F2Q68_00044170 [Brassica cretica]|uniref:Uncharacterized protein n=1 Tax=Brassica cretica TaxID=69181 RepID=A0A8S9LMN1_BRACR|nr:hypothetical protein F2Q68_00044170 [Brassica cretica]